MSAVPAPNAPTATTSYQLAPGEQACMTAVAVENPGSLAAQFELPPATPSPKGGPARGIGARRPRLSQRRPAAGGVRGLATLPVTRPRSLLAAACVVDRGDTDVVLLGSAEAAHDLTLGDGQRRVVVGDIALTLFDTQPALCSRRPERSSAMPPTSPTI